MSGYCGKLLRIDLTIGRITTEEIEAEVTEKFLGGRGVGTYYLNKEIDPTVDALVMVPIVLLIRWGGRVEATLLMFGEPLFVSVDAGHPRILFLLVLPIALIGGALYVRVGRTRK